jgi:hypothetical protein
MGSMGVIVIMLCDGEGVTTTDCLVVIGVVDGVGVGRHVRTDACFAGTGIGCNTGVSTRAYFGARGNCASCEREGWQPAITSPPIASNINL